ncbi:hypothetical protein ERX46_07345 [Brumimicrobium glaciale]|uniref:Carboxypeptidase-like regulatory domain-containing protein n=1 Tax=Brumimicrobium glaciale TaxID=200475 RepID=A0A4Q4KKL2_9FLAO|nr:DUF5686 family protein [Brumimicrobium glaciale]RYM33775.1 hypothetical protein ERX46_07345 [Brumimicrobium glaciale]
MKLIALLIIVFTAQVLFAQKQIKIVDFDTKTVLPFVKVIDNTGEVLLSDIDGIITLDLTRINSIELRFYGYKDTSYTSDFLKETDEITLSPDVQSFEEVVILPGENPAHRIIKNAIDKRKENHPTRDLSFSSEYYNKLIVTNDEILAIDTSALSESGKEIKETLEKQHIFLSETVGKKIFSPPTYTEDIISSYRTSGFENPLFATFGNQMQSFSFYDSQVEILGVEYINPIAQGSLRRYLFILQDTIITGADSTFIIRFQPRINKNFSGLEGFLHINTNNWAIEKVIAEPSEESSLTPRIVQEYTFLNNQKWFPSKLSATITADGLTFDDTGTHLLFKNNMYTKNVKFDIDVKKKFNNVEVSVEEDALENQNELISARAVEFDQKDSLTYIKVDSISDVNKLEYRLELAAELLNGNIPLGVVNIPLKRIIDFNMYEGYRLGLGLETSKKISKVFNVGGYFAYGFRDKEWKWGGYSTIRIFKPLGINLKFRYQEDVTERGGTTFHDDNFDLTQSEIYSGFYVNQMDRERLGEVVLSGRIKSNIQVKLIANYQRRWFTDGYAFSSSDPSVYSTSTVFDQAETAVELIWNIRERVMQLGDLRISRGTKFPRIKLKAAKGIKGLFESDYDYYRFNLEVYQDVSIRGVGFLSILSSSGTTTQNTPLSYQQASKGTGGNWNLSINNSFETMLPGEFYSGMHSDLFVRFNFLPIKTNLDWTKPQFGIHTALGWGEMNGRTSHTNIEFIDYSKGYTESGLLVNNLLVSGISGFGIGVFYRYGNYATPYVEDNLTYKITLSIIF